jgi:hypothetical protein
VIQSDTFQTIVGFVVGTFVAAGIGLLAKPVAADVPLAAPRIAVVMAVEAAPAMDLSNGLRPLSTSVAPTKSRPLHDVGPGLVATRASQSGSPAQTPLRRRHKGSSAPAAAPSPPPPSATPDPAPTPEPHKEHKPPKPPK